MKPPPRLTRPKPLGSAGSGQAELIDWVAALRHVFQRDEVLEVITEAAGTVNKETWEDSVDWTHIPGITCLLKLREDLVTTRALT